MVEGTELLRSSREQHGFGSVDRRIIHHPPDDGVQVSSAEKWITHNTDALLARACSG
jgi:hypothetical protein